MLDSSMDLTMPEEQQLGQSPVLLEIALLRSILLWQHCFSLTQTSQVCLLHHSGILQCLAAQQLLPYHQQPVNDENDSLPWLS